MNLPKDIEKKPYVILSAASSLDGYIATKMGDSALSNSKDWIRVHKLRKSSDAIIVGSGTIRSDDSKLTIDESLINEKVENHPLRIVVSSQGRIPLDARVITYRPEIPTLIAVTTQCSPRQMQNLEKKGCIIIECGEGPLVNLKLLLEILKSDYKVDTLMLEGGSKLNGEMLNQRLIDEIQLALAPVICGTGIPFFTLSETISKFSTSPFFEITAYDLLDDMIWLKMVVHYTPRKMS